jgi:hypothetical protein
MSTERFRVKKLLVLFRAHAVLAAEMIWSFYNIALPKEYDVDFLYLKNLVDLLKKNQK